MQHAGSCHCGRIAFKPDVPSGERANPKVGEGSIAVKMRGTPKLDLATLSAQRVDGGRL